MRVTKQGADGVEKTLVYVRVAGAVRAHLEELDALDQYGAVVPPAAGSTQGTEVAPGVQEGVPKPAFPQEQTLSREVLSALLELVSAALDDGRALSEFRAQALAVLAATPACPPESSS